MTHKTVVALYEANTEAVRVRDELERVDMIDREIEIIHNKSDSYNRGGTGLIARLSGYGVPMDDARAYTNGVEQGSSLIIARVRSEDVSHVVEILERYNPADVDRNWHESANLGAAKGVAAQTKTSMRHEASADDKLRESSQFAKTGRKDKTGHRDEEEVIPIVEEDVNISRREVEHGRLRVHSHVVETPVEEQVSLRDEKVTIERRPVSGSATDVPGDAFRERSFEVTETGEEAVVGKTRRVVEEVVVHKDVDEHTETIRDTERHTEVDIEDTRRGTNTPDKTR